VRLVWLLPACTLVEVHESKGFYWLVSFSIYTGMITENIWSHTLLFTGGLLFGVVGWDWNELQPSKSALCPLVLLQLLSAGLKDQMNNFINYIMQDWYE